MFNGASYEADGSWELNSDCELTIEGVALVPDGNGGWIDVNCGQVDLSGNVVPVGLCISLTPAECSVTEDCCETELTWNQELTSYTVQCTRICRVL